MEYIMGKNPMNRPYIVGWSDTAASHPHHRASHGSKDLNMDHPADQVHVLWGALVGGPDAGDWHRDITKDYVYNEVAVDYNAAIVGACAGLYHFYGTDQMKSEENFPPKESSYKSPEEIREFVVRAAVGQEDNRATQVLIEFTNETLLPPRYLNEARARYYFNISELFKYGQTVDNIEIDMQYDKMGTQPGSTSQVTYEIVQYNDAGDCYVEFTWKGYKYYGEMDLQFAILDKTPNEEYEFILDSSNDYSREGMVTEKGVGKPLNECPVEFDRITLYADGVHVWGIEPEGAPAGGKEPDEVNKEMDNPTGTVKYGDVDCNGEIDVRDAVLLARLSSNDTTADVSDKGKTNADVKGDGKVDAYDLTKLLQFLAKQIPESSLGKA